MVWREARVDRGPADWHVAREHGYGPAHRRSRGRGTAGRAPDRRRLSLPPHRRGWGAAQARADLEAEDRRTFQRQIAAAVALLQPLVDARIRTIAVLGNHDYAMRVPTALALPVVADELAQALRDAGVIVLRNEALPLGDRDADRPRSQRLFVAGLDAWFPRATDVAAALKQLPDQAPRIWLMHNPSSFRQLPPGSAPVALGAHTHGGQIRIPFSRIGRGCRW